ncbi:HAD family hydrolase [Paenibacillus thiaminolyticus]|uniref:HAD family hydrolase n=1 Tax=Paenibacillus thiaminolyticus TaxID=49283 RepID=UPI0011635C76|nr:HAD family hydrolase [Paenibacillus thiaminolyticus]NGP59283.1 HAD family hydrolase [Paenibacillus thiaminolyticus]WCR28556.1 HAD family hydrolase [Paenibacillus thiaminolyticus]
MYQAFLFDLDGTIIDSEMIGLRALQETLAELGLTYELDELRFSLGITSYKTMEKLNVKDIPAAIKICVEKEKPYMSKVPIFEGMQDVIARLPACGIVTSKTAEEMNDSFYLLGIDHYFQAVVCASDTSKHKPDPEPLELGLRRMDCTADNAIYIGDSVYDMKCAKAAGVDFGLALWGAKSASGFENARYIFETPHDIMKLLDESAKSELARK